MEYIVGSYLIVGAIFDGVKKRVPNWLSGIAIVLLGVYLVEKSFSLVKSSHGESFSFLLSHLICGIGIYILFYFFFCIGAFGGGDGKAAAIITIGIGLDAFLQVFLFSSCFAIMYGLFKLRNKGYKAFFIRILTFFRLILRDGLLSQSTLHDEMKDGLRVPFIPFVLAGFLLYYFFVGSGMIG